MDNSMDIEVVKGVFSIIVALITLTGVFITAIVSVYSLKKESYNKRVTEERIKWLNKRRELYGTIMAAWKLKKEHINNPNEYNNSNNFKGFYAKKRFEAERAKAEFISRLNTSTYSGNEYNFYIKEVVQEMNFINEIKENELKELDDKIKKMQVYVNKRLEQEWQRSKEETH